jgi:acyl carrier protein
VDASQGRSDADTLRTFIAADIVRDPSRHIGDDEPLLSSGLIDSFSLVDLSVFLERAFGARVPDHELTADRMNTINQILARIAEAKSASRL